MSDPVILFPKHRPPRKAHRNAAMDINTPTFRAQSLDSKGPKHSSSMEWWLHIVKVYSYGGHAIM